MEDTMSKNKGGVIAAIVIGVVVVTVGLFWLAQGGSYEILVADPIVGNSEAPIVLEEYSDFECPACAAAAPIVAAALEEFPNQVQLVYKDFPLARHTQARAAAAAALCAAQQDQFKPYHDKLFEGQQVWGAAQNESDTYFVNAAVDLGLDLDDWNQCRSSRDARTAVQEDVDEGFERGVNSTPSFFLNGERIEAPASVFGWVQLFEAELEKQGLTPENQEEQADSEESEAVDNLE